jgi:peptide/nickel transport system substrate-binding protein
VAFRRSGPFRKEGLTADLNAGRKRRTASIGRCGVFFCALVLATACRPASDHNSSASQPKRLLIGFAEGDNTNQDQGPAQLKRTLTLEGLTQVGIDGRATPKIAENWEWEDNGRRLRVHLRKNVIFHNGTHLNASLAATTLLTAARLQSNLFLYPALADILAIKPDGEYDLVIDVRRLSTFLPEDLEVPLNLAQTSTTDETEQIIGAGAYQIVSDSDSEIRLHRFAQYYPGPPTIEDVTIQSKPTMRTAWAGLLRGELDMVTSVPPDAVQFIRNEQIRIYDFPRRYVLLLGFNERYKPLQSSAVRRALNMAVDRDALVKTVLHGSATAAIGPFWPKHWAYDASMRAPGFDPHGAERLLDESGFPVRIDRNLDLAPARFRFTCLIPEGYVVLEDLALAIQKQLYDIGVDMQIESVTAKALGKRAASGDYQALISDMISGATLTRPYIWWRSTQQARTPFNVFGFENKEAERLFQELFAAGNETLVRSNLRSLQQVFLDDPPAIFIAWQDRTRAIARSFQVVQEPGRDPLFTLWQWNADKSVSTASAP